MRNAKKSVVLFMAVAIMALYATTAFADDMARSKSGASKVMNKLGRGLVNVVTGWVEIPKNIAVEWKKTDPFSGLVMGTIKGVGWTWGRTMTGVYDILTFPLPIPENYEPLMEPELILPDLWGKDFQYGNNEKDL